MRMTEKASPTPISTESSVFPPPLPPPVVMRSGFGARIRTWFLTGLIIAGPLAVTAWIVWWFVRTIDGWVKPLVPQYFWPDTYMPVEIPGVGVIMAFVGLTLLGFLTANLAGRTLLRMGEYMLDRMPVVRGIYKSVKQIFETVFSQSGTGFRKVGLVQYPAKGMWSVVFISTPPSSSVADKLPPDVNYISVFLPCTPNPTTGFYFYLPVSEVIEVSLSPDEAAKLIMSAGLIQPEGQAKLAAMAVEGKTLEVMPG
ncbi:putative membrane protein [Beijerinckia sp. GAS462]|nr:putative membrane protein [Beijerinckia sp. GAS462]SEC30554.1 Uncharacterized membrane protein [Beijerinckia sp. 28-YEA-48]